MSPQEKTIQNLDCSVIVLSYNNIDITDECLSRIEKAAGYSLSKINSKTQIIVVDNGSTDGSIEMIKTKHPHVHLIPLDENIGPPRANNVGLREATSPYILIINNDTYIKEDTITQMLLYLKEHSTCDALTARITYADGSFQPNIGHLPTPFKAIRWAFGLEVLPGLKKIIHPVYEHDESFYDSERKIEWVSTGFLMIKKEIYNTIGGMDENVFVYMEDVEWCERIRRAGFSLWYIPWIDVIHLGSLTIKKFPSAKALSWNIQGMANFQRKHYPLTAPVVMACIRLGMVLRAFLYTLLRRKDQATVYWEVSKLSYNLETK